MDVCIDEGFWDALEGLSAADQHAVKISLADFQRNPSIRGFQMHRVEKSPDPNFWSARVNDDLRMILHKTEASTLVAYVNRHDKAYAWARRRRIHTHPKTGLIRIVELPSEKEERLQVQPPQRRPHPARGEGMFEHLSIKELLQAGVPEPFVREVQTVTAEEWDRMARRLDGALSDKLEEYYISGQWTRHEPDQSVEVASPHLNHAHSAVEPSKVFANDRRDAFRDYLLTEFRSARTNQPLDRRSADSYRAYVTRLAMTLRIKLDDEVSSTKSTEFIEKRWLYEGAQLQIPANTLRNCRSALRAYVRFAHKTSSGGDTESSAD